MRKVFRILPALLLSLLVLSCTQNVRDDSYGTELVCISFSTGNGVSRALEADRDPFVETDYVWYYTASKSASDRTGLDYGSTSGASLPVKPGAQGEGRKGLTGAVIDGLSQGLWDFTLYAYRYDSAIVDYVSDDSAILVWSGNVIEQRVGRGLQNVVNVSVSPVTVGKGSIVFGTIVPVDGNGNPRTDAAGPDYTVKRLDSTQLETDYTSLDAGSYLVTVGFSQTGTQKTAQESFVVNIFGGQTTTVSGTVVCLW